MNRKVVAAAGVVGVIAAASIGWSIRTRQATPSYAPLSVGNLHVDEYGIACYMRSAGVGPVHYPVDALGKPGVPKPTADQISMLRRIEAAKDENGKPQFTHLWFTWLPVGEFVVFEAPGNRDEAPPCTDQAYPVLNECSWCYYEPAAAPEVFAGPQKYMQNRPWIKWTPGP